MKGWTQIAVGLGANLGDRHQNLKRAALKLLECMEDVRSSSVYESEPWGGLDQPLYLNAVLVGASIWKPPALVNFFKMVEREQGRVDNVRYGPRLIDLDLLVYGDEVWNTESIVVPHSQLEHRDFVLIPLSEVWADWRHPLLERSALELAQNFSSARSTRKVAPALLDWVGGEGDQVSKMPSEFSHQIAGTGDKERVLGFEFSE